MESLILPLGLVAAAMSAWLFHRTLALLKDGVRTKGVVIHVHSSYSAESRKPLHTPVVQFTDRTGRDVVFKSRTSTTSPQYFVGRNVGVLYREAMPDKAQLDTLFGLWGAPAICAIIGAAFVYAGLFGTAI